MITHCHEDRSCLIVDDNQGVRQAVRDLLESENWQVEEAADGIEALEKIRTSDYSVILLDVLMPEKDGLEVLQALGMPANAAGSRVVAMSGGGSQVAGSLALKLAEGFGAKAVLYKPFSIDELKAALG